MLSLHEWEEIKALEAQGHTIIPIMDSALNECDLIIGPQCHSMAEPWRKYFKLSIAEARKKKYSTETWEEILGLGSAESDNEASSDS